ncbi:MAG TPA: hypothetical protein VN374_06625 [Desulfitobacteriaceae bacterium]|nr:hypothetical protein [Desulfitobacteriaceae bacterium]
MKCRNDKYEISLARPEDSRQLLNIYECGDFKGNISVLYTRRPDPYKSLLLEGEKAVIPIVTDKAKGVIVGMGACIIRKAYINGAVKITGYLSGLKGLSEYRKRVPSIAEVYQYLYELTKDEVDIYYTTILKDNLSVQKMLEKKRKNMPEYRPQGEYTVYCFRTGAWRNLQTRQTRQTRQKNKEYSLENGDTEELKSLYQAGSGSYNFSLADLNLYGLAEKDIYILRNRQGKVVAACVLWNQQSYKQYIVTEYRGIYKYLKKLPLRLLGYPDLPSENIPANYGSITLLAVKNNDVLLAAHFLKMVAEKADRYDFLMLGFFETHPLSAALARIKCIKYQSKLYTVHWPDKSLSLDNRPINLEVGLL